MKLFVTRRLPIDVELAGVQVDVFPGDAPPTSEELREGAQDADAMIALLTDRIDASFLEACPSLKIVANYAVGYDNVDAAAATERGVWVTNTPGVLTEATADLYWTLLLAVARRVREGDAQSRSGNIGPWSPTQLLGMELHGATLGVFGFGRIGRAVARRAKGFGMKVLFTNRTDVPKDEWEGATPADLETLLNECNVLALCAPLTAQTQHVIDGAAFRRMRRDAILINGARGPLVDEAALVAALEAGEIGGAGLDVYEEEPVVHPGLLAREDVVLMPHLGSATHSTRRRMAEIAVANVAAVLRGESPPNAVNDPRA